MEHRHGLDFSLSFEHLKAKYAAALAEFDARPPEYTPRRQLTAAGAALLYRPDLDDAAERAAREAREAKRKAERELRERQRQHPLYHTHHRPALLKAWKEHGEPSIPDKALAGFTDWIMRHANALEDDVRQHAQTFAKAHPKTVIERLGNYGTSFFDDENPTPRTERNMRRALRAAFRQFNEQSAHILGLVGKYGQKYVSNDTRQGRRIQLQQQQKWIEATTATSDKKTVPLSACVRTPEARFAELYTLVKGQESYFTEIGLTPLFVTLTSPARYHPNPSKGDNSWDGSSVLDSHTEFFNPKWQKFRYSIKNLGIKIEGFRVTEPHQDGAEHWHVLIYAKKADIEIIKKEILKQFAHSQNAVKFITDFKPDKENRRASAASYMMKYLIKSITSGATTNTTMAANKAFKNEVDMVDAWRSTWNIRAFQFFGTLHGKLTLWREMRRLNKSPTDDVAAKLWRAARGGRGAIFIALLSEADMEIAAIREVVEAYGDPDPTTGEIQVTDVKPGRILGVKINGISYITHKTKFEIVTDYSFFNEDNETKILNEINDRTVIHNSPSGPLREPLARAKPPPRRKGFDQRAA